MGQVIVDPAFIQELQHRPNLSFTVDDGIPTIDLSRPGDDPSLVTEIRHACRNWGFFQVINHGVPAEKRSRIEDVARRFFSLPLEEKNKVRRDEKRVLGYYDTEHTKNVRDWKEVFDITAHDPTCVPASYYPEDSEITWWRNQWPQHPPDLREVCEDYVSEMEKLAFRLMELIALSLGIPGDRFSGFFDEQTTFMRLNHYPACPYPQLALGVGRHKDAGALTILAQDDVGGLEVKRKRDGEWIRVRPTPDAFIINVGDMIQVWSNEEYESVEHRVMVNSERERFSIPFFFNPGHSLVVEPLREVVEAQGRPAKYKGYNWGKFLVIRKRSNFMKLDVENIQIHHFKITS